MLFLLDYFNRRWWQDTNYFDIRVAAHNWWLSLKFWQRFYRLLKSEILFEHHRIFFLKYLNFIMRVCEWIVQFLGSFDSGQCLFTYSNLDDRSDWGVIKIFFICITFMLRRNLRELSCFKYLRKDLSFIAFWQHLFLLFFKVTLRAYRYFMNFMWDFFEFFILLRCPWQI